MAASRRALRAALDGAPALSATPGGIGRRRSRTLGNERALPEAVAPADALLAEYLRRVDATPPPRQLRTLCGFEVSGGPLVAALSAGVTLAVQPGDGGVLQVALANRATNVLLVFADGRGALLPAIPNFVAAVNYDAVAGELIDVAYEPAEGSQHFAELRDRLPELRRLRQVMAAASALGAFRPEDSADRAALVERLREVRGLDPVLALYAAYSFHELGADDALAAVYAQQSERLGMTLFDVTMLARGPLSPPAPMPAEVVPAVPLLARGWALLAAYGFELPSSFAAQDVRGSVTDSLWTLFDHRGVALVRKAIESGEVR